MKPPRLLAKLRRSMNSAPYAWPVARMSLQMLWPVISQSSKISTTTPAGDQPT
jgi:hypothetical protein